MPIITISILGGKELEVDEMEQDEEGENCPLPTQDPELNARNKQTAVTEANYREQNTGAAFRVTKQCGNCAAYNITEEILDCIGEDVEDMGYCQIYKFVCGEYNVCDDWASGGPLTSEKFSTKGDVF